MNLYNLHIEEMRKEYEHGNLTEREWDDIEQTAGERYGRIDCDIDALRQRLNNSAYYVRKEDMKQLLETMRMMRSLLFGSPFTNRERREGVLG
jgi:hypothetical protein